MEVINQDLDASKTHPQDYSKRELHWMQSDVTHGSNVCRLLSPKSVYGSFLLRLWNRNCDMSCCCCCRRPDEQRGVPRALFCTASGQTSLISGEWLWQVFCLAVLVKKEGGRQRKRKHLSLTWLVPSALRSCISNTVALETLGRHGQQSEQLASCHRISPQHKYFLHRLNW